MSLPTISPNLSDERWLVDAVSSEIRAHQAIFFGLLCPLLALGLPAQISYVTISYLSERLVDATLLSKAWAATAWAISLVVVGVAFLQGLFKDRARLAAETGAALRDSIPLPPKQGPRLLKRVDLLWSELAGTHSKPPVVIHRRSFDVLAHAYDDGVHQQIEITSSLAQKIVHDDPLGIAILKHEIAHLVRSDLPAIRRQSLATAGGIRAIKAASLLVVAAAVLIFLVTNFGTFPLEATLVNVLSANLVILLGLAVVLVPLVVGALALQRYAGFIVALIETRADVSAGTWGLGLNEMSRLIEDDPTVRASTLLDLGKAYLSPFISHLPTRDRANLLKDPGRLATPKLRYFAIAIVLTWLLPFHQGTATWDRLPLVGVVALLQGLTTNMLLVAGIHLRLGLWRLFTLALVMLIAQALPALPLDGPVYLLQHLIASLVRPGGFGPADQANYIKDISDVLSDFSSTIAATLGGYFSPAAIFIIAGSLWFISRLARIENCGFFKFWAASAASIVSILTSFDFFQSKLYAIIRTAAFEASDHVGEPLAWYWGVLPDSLRHAIAAVLWSLSEHLDGHVVHGPRPWPVLVLPQLVALAIMFAARLWRDKPDTSSQNNEAKATL